MWRSLQSSFCATSDNSIYTVRESVRINLGGIANLTPFIFVIFQHFSQSFVEGVVKLVQDVSGFLQHRTELLGLLALIGHWSLQHRANDLFILVV